MKRFRYKKAHHHVTDKLTRPPARLAVAFSGWVSAGHWKATKGGVIELLNNATEAVGMDQRRASKAKIKLKTAAHVSLKLKNMFVLGHKVLSQGTGATLWCVSVVMW